MARVNDVPLKVMLAESVSKPPVVLYITRPEVKPVLVNEVNLPVLGVVPPIAGGLAK